MKSVSGMYTLRKVRRRLRKLAERSPGVCEKAQKLLDENLPGEQMVLRTAGDAVLARAVEALQRANTLQEEIDSGIRCPKTGQINVQV